MAFALLLDNKTERGKSQPNPSVAASLEPSQCAALCSLKPRTDPKHNRGPN